MPRVEQSFVKDFFDTLYQDIAENPELPVWSGELYLEYHRGTYTSMAVSYTHLITPLAESSSALTESLRDGVVPDNLAALFGRVEKDYTRTLSAIRELISA